MDHADAAGLLRIVSDISKLAKILSFGDSRLQDFSHQVNLFQLAVSTASQPRQYQTCLNQHQNLSAMLNTTVESLIEWKSKAKEYLQQLTSMNFQNENQLRITSHNIFDIEKELLAVLQNLQQQLTFMQDLQKQLVQCLAQLKQKKSDIFPTIPKGNAPMWASL